MNNMQSDFPNLKRTWVVEASLPVSFKIQYSNALFSEANTDLALIGTPLGRAIVVIEENVFELYKTELHNYFSFFNINVETVIVPAAEEHKTWETVDTILKFFEDTGIRRREPVIAIGGGVLLDVVGFCASIYRRGIPYVKVPTTLLAMVDASVGVKVGINHVGRRNRLGAYYPPIATLLDKTFLKTLPQEEIVNGLGEIFKMAVIKDAELFSLIEENFDQLLTEKFQFGSVPVRVINRSITGMVSELAPNLWEKNLERCVDFGHSFSPLIEMDNIPNLPHGRAVVLDCLFSSCIAFNRGYIDEATLCRIFSTANHLGLPVYHKDFTDVECLTVALTDTIKHRNGNQYLPVPIGIGEYSIINDLTVEEIEKAAQLFSKFKVIGKCE